MYAVVKTGGKQERVEQGQRLAVELLGAGPGEEVSLPAVLVVDGPDVLATPAELAGVQVVARVLGEGKGPKVRGFVYKPKARSRRRWGHRQRYTNVEVVSISVGRATAGRATAGRATAGKAAVRKGSDKAGQEEA